MRPRPAADALILRAVEACRAQGLPVAYAAWAALDGPGRRAVNARLLALGCDRASRGQTTASRFARFVADCDHGMMLPGAELYLVRDGMAAVAAGGQEAVDAAWNGASDGWIRLTNFALDRMGVEAPGGPDLRFRAFCMRAAGRTPTLERRRDREAWDAVLAHRPFESPMATEAPPRVGGRAG